MINKILLGALTILISFVWINVSVAEDVKIGFVDVEKVFNEYEKTKQNDSSLKEKGKQKAQERAGIVAEIKKQKEEMELLSESGKAEKQAIIEEKLKELKNFDEDTKNALRQERDEVLKEIFQDIKNIIDVYGKDNGYTFILNEKALLYKTDTLDVTNEIVKQLNLKKE